MVDFLFLEDTIGAVATAPGRGAIGIIRLSGPAARSILLPFWEGRPLDQLCPRTASLGKLKDSRGTLLDECLLLFFKGPASYTGEDMVELHCHGNPDILKSILRLLVTKGIRLAEPGEFTYRAFRNGRIDLVQAEAVAQLIEARSLWARQHALSTLAENGSHWVQELLDEVLEIWTPIEADLEFPTEGLGSLQLSQFIPALKQLQNKIRDLQSRSCQYGKLQEGYRVVIAGETNAGKSSLLNAILGYGRALVTEIAGTTRDTLEENLEIHGIPIRLIDTAGLGEARDYLDQQGMERSRNAIDQADLLLVVIDISQQPEACSIRASNWLKKEGIRCQCPILVVGSKMDLVPSDSPWFQKEDLLLVSALERRGLEKLLESIAQTLNEKTGFMLDDRIMLNQRQTQILEQVNEGLDRCLENIENQASQDLIATDLIEMKNALEDLSGKTLRADLLESIFSRFCIGK